MGIVREAEAERAVLGVQEPFVGDGDPMGIRAYETARRTAMFRLAEHIGRVFRSDRILGIPMPYDHATLTEVCVKNT